MEKKRAVLIVEAISTGKQYVYDAIERGYVPIALYPYKPVKTKEQEIYEKERKSTARKFPAETIVLHPETDDYEELLAALDVYRIVAVVQGSRTEAALTDRLAHDLGVSGNDPAYTICHTDKYEMQKKLEDKGLCSIHGRLCETGEEAEAFMKSVEAKRIVIKTVSITSSMRAQICSTDQEIRHVFEQYAASEETVPGQNDEKGNEAVSRRAPLLVQECLEGTEYIVNTCSCGGHHMVTDLWRYHKIPVAGDVGGSAYDYAALVRELLPEQEELCRYAMQVVDALGIKYGPTYGEYILTDEGPCMISLSTCPMNPEVKRPFLEKGLGHHITDLALDSYISGNYFRFVSQNPYEPRGSLMFKYFIAQKNQIVYDFPIIPILRKIKSYHSLNIRSKILTMQLEKTVDTSTASGLMYLASESETQIWNDYYLIRSLEKDYFSLLFSGQEADEGYESESRSWTREEKTEILQKLTDKRLNTLILYTHAEENEFVDVWKDSGRAVTVIGIEETSRLAGMWNRIIFDFDCRAPSMEDLIEAIFQVSDTLAPGGHALIPGWSLANFPHGKEGLLAVLLIAGLKINIPRWNSMDIITLTKKS